LLVGIVKKNFSMALKKLARNRGWNDRSVLRTGARNGGAISRWKGEKMKPLRTYEAAQRLDCTQRTVRRLLDQGKLHGFKMGGTWRINNEEIIRIELDIIAKLKPALNRECVKDS